MVVVEVVVVLEVVVVMALEEHQELQCHWPPAEVLPEVYYLLVAWP